MAQSFCEAACACPPQCTNRFPGCKCPHLSAATNSSSSGPPISRCGTRLCLCFASQRECDPDLCRSCGCEVPLDCGLSYRHAIAKQQQQQRQQQQLQQAADDDSGDDDDDDDDATP